MPQTRVGNTCTTECFELLLTVSGMAIPTGNVYAQVRSSRAILQPTSILARKIPVKAPGKILLAVLRRGVVEMIPTAPIPECHWQRTHTRHATMARTGILVGELSFSKRNPRLVAALSVAKCSAILLKEYRR